jgi:hypothetical protein
VTDDFPLFAKTAAYPRLTGADFLTRCSPNVRAFYEYWDSKRLLADGARRPMPSRADLDPTEMKPWLANIILVDVSDEPRRLSYRLVGSNQVDLRQRDVTGKPVEEGYFGESLAAVQENYRLVIDEGLPVYDWSPIPSASGVPRPAQALLLPLSGNGLTVDKVIVYMETEPF